MEEVKRAAGYIRVSTAEQVQKKLSIETQIAEIKNYAKLHNMRLEEIYIDRGITARKSLEKRIDFMRMMEDVESGRINHIIVLRLDRFFRNVYDYHRMMNEYLEPNKCDWSAVKESYTTTTTNGRLMINLRLSIAEQECDTDSDRIKDVLDHRARQGFAITASQPFGYKIVDHRVVPDEEKRKIVQDMFDQMELLSSVGKVWRYINNKYGTSFSYITTLKMLGHTLYTGVYRDIKNYCEPIISQDQFDRVQRLLKINTKVRKNKATHMFSGLLVCEHCNRKMVGKYYTYRDREYYYYRCNHAFMREDCENKTAIKLEDIEAYLHANVPTELEKHLKNSKKAAENAKTQKSNRKAIEVKLQRLNELYVNGFIDMEKYKADFADLQSQIVDDIVPKVKEKDLALIENFVQGLYKENYDNLTMEGKQALWRSIIKEIRVSGKVVTDIKFI